ncbi:MAG: hypothetical protein IJS15_07270, partial [Victivallales bacterium]|nr:hypothetical protein [Victivallales bacterium]
MLLFGLILLSLSGLSWVVTGVVMGRAPKDGLDAGFIITMEAALCLIFVAVMMAFTGIPNVPASHLTL